MTNLYRVLGVSPTASHAEIKQAYRELAKRHHPDRGGDAARFAEIDAAYQILSDPARRAEYDAQRRAWLEEVDAVGCPACGEPNRVRGVPRGKVPLCAECKAELPRSAPSPLAQRAAEAGLDLAERGIAHTEALLRDGVDLTFAKLRERIGLGRARSKGR